MALEFTVSSPGKVILHGEHSVVFGKPAIAGVIGLTNYLTLQTSKDPKIILNFEIFKEPLQVDLNLYNQYLKKMFEIYGEFKMPELINHDDFLNEITKFISEVLTISPALNLKTLQSIFYLLTGILISFGENILRSGIILTFKTGIPMGAGLGSSASFAVCLSSAFYFYSKLKTNSNYIHLFNTELSSDEQYVIKRAISDWAFFSERIMHGTPSGLDNTTCTFGNIVTFSKGSKPMCIELQKPINYLLVNSGVSRSTAILAKNVAQLKHDHSQMVENILQAMGALVEDVVKILETGMEDDISFMKLSRLVVVNNNLLRSLGVSHPSLEKIFALSEKYGFSAKLTGAGGGGYAIVLLPDNYEHSIEFKNLCQDLNHNDFEFSFTKIGGAGIEIVQN